MIHATLVTFKRQVSGDSRKARKVASPCGANRDFVEALGVALYLWMQQLQQAIHGTVENLNDADHLYLKMFLPFANG